MAVKKCLKDLVSCCPDDERQGMETALEALPLQEAEDDVWLLPAKTKSDSAMFYEMLIFSSAAGRLNCIAKGQVDGFQVNIIRHRKDIQPSRSSPAVL